MPQVVVTRTIDVPIEQVFDTVAHIEQFSKVVPEITRVEFLSEQKSGVGTRFRETRMMKKREATVELEITESLPHERIRFRSDAGGTIWDTVYTLSAISGRTELTLRMDARPYKLLAKMTIPLIMGMVRAGVERDMDSVKTWCEANQ